MDASYQNGLTALAGGAQAGATKIGTLGGGAATFTRFSTVVTAGDSAALPAAAAGLTYFVKNAGAASMNIFPGNGTDIINALAVNTAFAVAAGKIAMFTCMFTGVWDAGVMN
jgi:hypothetical protein